MSKYKCIKDILVSAVNDTECNTKFPVVKKNTLWEIKKRTEAGTTLVNEKGEEILGLSDKELKEYFKKEVQKDEK